MTIYICENCGLRFGEDEQTISEHRDGQCPGCLGENVTEEGATNIEEQCKAGVTAQSP